MNRAWVGLALLAFFASGCGGDDKEGAASLTVVGTLGNPIPFTLHSNIPVAQVSINGDTPRNFIVDTGAQLVLIDAAYGKEIGFQTTLFPQPLDSVGVGDVTFEHVTALTYDLSDLTAQLGVKVDGFLGASLFENFALAFDYKESELYFLDGDESAMHLEQRTDIEHTPKVINGEIQLGFFLTEVKLKNDETERQMLLDTGASATVLTQSTFDALNLPAERERIPGLEGVGQVGEFMLELLRTCRARAGDAEVKNMLLAVAPDSVLSQAKVVLPRLTGLLGYTFMREFLVVIDYDDAAARLYPFTERPHIDADEFVGVGVLPVRMNSRLLVGAVVVGSDAEAKGIEVDDELLSIDGEVLVGLDDVAVGELLDGAIGETKTLSLLRGQTEMTVEVLVEDLLPDCP